MITEPCYPPPLTLPKPVRPASVIILGILLPLAAVAVELLTDFSRSFVDTLPTPWHLLLVLLVPTGLFASWRGIDTGQFRFARPLSWWTGFVAAIALLYSALFAPMLLLAIPGVILVLPVVVFAPVSSLWIAFKLARCWSRLPGARRFLWLGFAGGMAVLLVLASPELGARVGATLASSSSPGRREFGYRILAAEPVQRQLSLSASSNRLGSVDSLISLLSLRGPLGQSEARRLHYLATGAPADSPATNRWDRWQQSRGATFPPQGAGTVNLQSSRIDGSIDARSAVSYLEWTLVLHNPGAVRQEGTLEILLPRGAVVSRATLWIAGVEREAAFGESGQVRQAYQSVVNARRDPLLVTTHGADYISVRCFPIEPQSDMQFRLGISVPLEPEANGNGAVLRLPAIVDGSLSDPGHSRHWVWLESRSEIESLSPELHAGFHDGAYEVSGSLTGNRPAAARVPGIEWAPVWTAAWPTAKEEPPSAVLQEFAVQPLQAPRRLEILVDASATNEPFRRELERAIGEIPRDIVAEVTQITREGTSPWPPAGPWTGGVDPAFELHQALRRALVHPESAVVWIAGNQPLPSAPDFLRQPLERAGRRNLLYILNAGSINTIVSSLEALDSVRTISSVSPGDDLRKLFADWRSGQQSRVPVRRLVSLNGLDPQAQGSPHIARLWAAEQVAAMAHRHRQDAVTLGTKYHIVTPLTGAVVLETAAQYQQNGITPASEHIPSLPEPETWALLLAGVASVAACRYWQRRERTA